MLLLPPLLLPPLYRRLLHCNYALPVYYLFADIAVTRRKHGHWKNTCCPSIIANDSNTIEFRVFEIAGDLVDRSWNSKILADKEKWQQSVLSSTLILRNYSYPILSRIYLLWTKQQPTVSSLILFCLLPMRKSLASNEFKKLSSGNSDRYRISWRPKFSSTMVHGHQWVERTENERGSTNEVKNREEKGKNKKRILRLPIFRWNCAHECSLTRSSTRARATCSYELHARENAPQSTTAGQQERGFLSYRLSPSPFSLWHCLFLSTFLSVCGRQEAVTVRPRALLHITSFHPRRCNARDPRVFSHEHAARFAFHAHTSRFFAGPSHDPDRWRFHRVATIVIVPNFVSTTTFSYRDHPWRWFSCGGTELYKESEETLVSNSTCYIRLMDLWHGW